MIRSHHRRFKSSGFTLIEVLIALVIFALISVAVFRLFDTVTQAQTAVKQSSQDLNELQRVWLVVGKDLSQAVVRTSRRKEKSDELSSEQDTNEAAAKQQRPVFLGNEDNNLVAFTRMGWRNPLEYPRSDLQQVIYRFEDGSLVRLYWPHLDPEPKEEPRRQVVIKDIKGVTFEFLDQKNEWKKKWGATTNANAQSTSNVNVDNNTAAGAQPQTGKTGQTGSELIPRAVQITIDKPPYGETRRVFLIGTGHWPSAAPTAKNNNDTDSDKADDQDDNKNNVDEDDQDQDGGGGGIR